MLAAEHFIYANPIKHVFLSLLFNRFISHGYVHRDFIKTAIVPIIKNKTRDSSNKSNYKPMALVTACSKIFEIVSWKRLNNICKHMTINSDLKNNIPRTYVSLL